MIRGLLDGDQSDSTLTNVSGGEAEFIKQLIRADSRTSAYSGGDGCKISREHRERKNHRAIGVRERRWACLLVPYDGFSNGPRL